MTLLTKTQWIDKHHNKQSIKKCIAQLVVFHGFSEENAKKEIDELLDIEYKLYLSNERSLLMIDEEVEDKINELGLTAPRVTLDHIKSLVKDGEYHVFKNSCLTVCCLTLKNGFTVTGESACASPENFNKELGEKIAFTNALNKIWSLEGYLLKERLYKGEVK